MPSNNGSIRKASRREAANARQAAHDALTPAEQIAKFQKRAIDLRVTPHNELAKLNGFQA